MASGSENPMQDIEAESENLSSLFGRGLDLFNNLGKIDEPTNSPTVQINIGKAMRIFEDCTRLVSIAGMFSTNEEAEEILTEHLRYLLLPALLGTLCLKLTSRNRKEIVVIAETYYTDFLQRCNSYGLSNYKFKKVDTNSEPQSEDRRLTTNKTEFESIKEAVNTRAGKIQRYKEQKELQTKLADLKINMENENVDEEIKRNYYLTMIKLFIYEAMEELGSIEAEKLILEHMATLNQDEKPKQKRPPAPLRPVIITKDAVQKAVFGAGYPSLPVMSVEEFYEKRVQDGIWPGADATKAAPLSLQDSAGAGVSLRDEADAELQEKLEEEEDQHLVEQMRQRDDFKDDHRRGWGNRMNRS